MLRLTGYFSALAAALFWVWGVPLAQGLYGSGEAGFYLRVLAPAMPLMYLESMVDGAMKGLGEQKAVFRYSVWDSILRIAGVVFLLPRFGMKGFLFVILILQSLYLRSQYRTAALGVWFAAAMDALAGAPALSGLAASVAGLWLRCRLGPVLAQGRAVQLAALALGAFGTALAGAAAAWPLGLGREMCGG